MLVDALYARPRHPERRRARVRFGFSSRLITSCSSTGIRHAVDLAENVPHAIHRRRPSEAALLYEGGDHVLRIVGRGVCYEPRVVVLTALSSPVPDLPATLTPSPSKWDAVEALAS